MQQVAWNQLRRNTVDPCLRVMPCDVVNVTAGTARADVCHKDRLKLTHNETTGKR